MVLFLFSARAIDPCSLTNTTHVVRSSNDNSFVPYLRPWHQGHGDADIRICSRHPRLSEAVTRLSLRHRRRQSRFWSPGWTGCLLDPTSVIIVPGDGRELQPDCQVVHGRFWHTCSILCRSLVDENFTEMLCETALQEVGACNSVAAVPPMGSKRKASAGRSMSLANNDIVHSRDYDSYTECHDHCSRKNGSGLVMSRFRLLV